MATDGLCECGCGEMVSLAAFTNRTNGWVKDQPVRFKKGHARRTDHKDGKKRCSLCGEWWPLEDYQKSKWNRDGLDHRCRSCNRLRGQRGRIQAHGLTWDDYLAMFEAQGHACAICRRPHTEISLGIDHSHATGKVRGLLCRGCNSGMGQLQESPTVLRAAADYLEAHI